MITIYKQIYVCLGAKTKFIVIVLTAKYKYICLINSSYFICWNVLCGRTFAVSNGKRGLEGTTLLHCWLQEWSGDFFAHNEYHVSVLHWGYVGKYGSVGESLV